MNTESFMPDITTTTLEASDLTIFLVILVIALVALGLTRRLLNISFPYLFFGTLGAILGLWVGSLARPIFTDLPGIYGRWVPLIVHVFITVAILDLFIAQTKTVANFASRLLQRLLPQEGGLGEPSVVVDTSALIDGRLEGVVKAGFVFGKILIPKFILDELQHIADSTDPLRRARGRRGMDVLSAIKKTPQTKLEIIYDEPKVKGADSKLVAVAKKYKAKILTCDYNLNKVATIEGSEVLNVNELSEMLKPVVLPGESLEVKIVQKGKEKGQGVGYLPDGTMIVVEGGADLVGETVSAQVVRIFQTVAGKMVFVEPKNRK
jgi:uncharacterized protein YacL